MKKKFILSVLILIVFINTSFAKNALTPSKTENNYSLITNVGIIDYNFLQGLNLNLGVSRPVGFDIFNHNVNEDNSEWLLLLNYMRRSKAGNLLEEYASIFCFRRYLFYISNKLGTPYFEIGPSFRLVRESQKYLKNEIQHDAVIKPGLWFAIGWQAKINDNLKLNLQLTFITTKQFATTGGGFGVQIHF